MAPCRLPSQDMLLLELLNMGGDGSGVGLVSNSAWGDVTNMSMLRKPSQVSHQPQDIHVSRLDHLHPDLPGCNSATSN